ncbi:MAG TPA: CsgG/HfaB family protein [bacterium]|nr:CsgG/HfaB family protein [bacterium]
MRKIAGFLAYLFAVNAVLATTPTVAVVDFEGINCSQDYARGVTEILSSRLSDTGAFRLIERGQIIRVLEEQAFQTSGLVDPSTAVQIGQILGADYVGVGSITKFGNTYTVSTRFVKVETAEITLADTFTAEGEDQIPSICNDLAKEMASKASVIHLRIRANDDGVEAYVNGQYIGVCPVEYDVTTGSHKIKFVYSGTYGYQKTIDVKYADVDVGKTFTINCPTSSSDVRDVRLEEERLAQQERERLARQAQEREELLSVPWLLIIVGVGLLIMWACL